MKKSVFEQFCNGSSSTLDYSNGTPLDLGNEPPVAAIPSQCCAFLKLQKIVGASSDRTSRWNVSCHQFVLWVLIFRNQDPQIEEGVKRSCPLARCRYTGDPDDVKFIRHIVMCQFLKFGEYKCPYNKHETERFMVSQKKKRWHRGQELREAVLTCTRRLCKAFSHPITSTNSTQLDNTNEAHTSNNNCHPSWADYARFKCPMNSSANANYENPNADECGFPASREPNLKKRKPDDDTRRSTESHPYSPISSREAGCNDGGSYAAELDTEVIYELGSIPKPGPILGLSEMSNGDEHLRMDKDWLLNSSDYISMKDFNTPITRQAIRELGRSLQSCAASRIYLDVDFDESTSHKQRLQPSTSDLTTQVYKKRRRSKSPMLLSIDTGDHGSNLTPASSSIVATHYISSTPDSPGVPELEPGEFIKDLQSILFRVNCKAVAFLSISPRSAISSQISLEPLSAAHVYELGWMAVKTILGGGFPADIKILFCLAQLAVSCAQTVWGNSIIFQLDEFHCELENWAAVLPTEDQEAFIELISSILGPEMPVIQRGQLPRNTSNPHLSMSNSKSNRWNYLSSLSQQGRQKALKDGIAIRSCFQYLSSK